MKIHDSRFFAATVMALSLLIVPSALQGGQAQTVGAVLEAERLVVLVDGKEFTAYKFGKEHKYPFFYPINGPVTGKSITAWDQEPYPHHSSLYISLDLVRSKGIERGNYWQPRHELDTGHILSKAPRIMEATGNRVVLRDESVWIVPATNVRQLRDTRTVTISAPSPGIRIMDFVFEIQALEDLAIGPTGHSFFSVRMNSHLSVGCPIRGPEYAAMGSGTMIDSLGNRDEAGTRGKSAPWCAYYGTHHGKVEGIAIIQHSGNLGYPAPWFNRDYGFMSPTPFAFDKDPVSIKAGQTLIERYRVVVFSGDHESADLAGWNADFEK